MTEVFQRRVDQGNGDCAQAALASLLDMSYDDVPDFVSNHVNVNMNVAIMRWLEDMGHTPCYMSRSRGDKVNRLIKIATFDGGISGYFYASVPSQTFEGVSHAVIVDAKLNIVHDPNPNGRAMRLGPNDVLDILTVSDFYIDITGEFVRM